MRRLNLVIPLLALAATPAAAAPASQHQQIQIPPELTDPEFIDRITGMTEALSKALLNMPVGELEAVAEGRPVTDADRRRTVRDTSRISERDLQQHIAEARPQIQAAMQALATSLPAMTRALSEMAEQVERAAANIPQPGYPRP
jgi:hypothetical protein